MEALRPFWEGIIGISDSSTQSDNSKEHEGKEENTDVLEYHGYLFRNDEKMNFPINDGKITVDLFDNNGEMQSGQTLFVQKQNTVLVDLIHILEERIRRGVEQFFSSVMLLFDDNKPAYGSGVDEIQIFLAGNSSKSPILHKLFKQYIQQENDKINGGKSDNSHFNLFPPLGTAEAVELQKEKGLKVHTDITAPTGKTGVAYGLIEGREGGQIRVISSIRADSRSKFMFNIGRARKGKFSIVLDRNEVVYGKWVRFCVADSEDFELYYTTLPGAGNMPVTDSAIHKISCHIPAADKEKDIYIRATEDAPVLEYCVVSKEKEPDETAEIFRVVLDE